FLIVTSLTDNDFEYVDGAKIRQVDSRGWGNGRWGLFAFLRACILVYDVRHDFYLRHGNANFNDFYRRGRRRRLKKGIALRLARRKVRWSAQRPRGWPRHRGRQADRSREPSPPQRPVKKLALI